MTDKRAKILIIEDEKYLADLYKMKFENEGYTVLVAREGHAGLGLARREKPDLILLDLIMPGIDGYETLEELKSDPSTKYIRVFILTNLGQDQEVKKGQATEAEEYLVKANLTPEQLASKVKTALASGSESKTRTATGKEASAPETDNQIHDGRQVLLLEDDKSLQEMYALRLRQDGCHVSTAGNGAWGYRLARDKEFDVIVLDIMMPALNGYGFMDKVRQSSRNRKTPIIVVSNSAQEADIREAKDHGADSYFLKSRITPAKLSKEVDRLLKANK